MMIFNYKNFTMSGLILVFLASINVAQAENFPTNHEEIPPAPLGPYISTALLESEADKSATETLPVEEPSTEDSPVVVPVSGDNKKVFVTKPALQVDTNEMPMQAFSPDIPWPADIRPPSSPSSGRWIPNQMMRGYDGRQVSPDNLRQQNSQQQNRSSYYRAPVTDNSVYSRRLDGPQAANQQMQKIPNTVQPRFEYQTPNSYMPRNNFSSGKPAGSMSNPYLYQPVYTN
jgi:hypothetical protein